MGAAPDAVAMTDRQLRVGAWVVAGIWVAGIVIASLQGAARHSNNFEIFRTSFDNLVADQDLYAASARHQDFNKYSPTFSLLFAPFALLPFALGLLLWNAVNAGALYWSLGRVLDPAKALAARSIVFLDALGALQNAQSNTLIAGLMILAFAELERRREWAAAIAITVGTLIKIFPIAAAALAIFRPYRVPRFVAWGVLVAVVAAAAPLLVTSPETLAMQYRSWLAIMKTDALMRGYGVMEHIQLLFGADLPNGPIQLAGLVILLAPLLRYSFWEQEYFRLLFLASLLMFCVLFNHKAESPTFVIASAGVALWFVLASRGGMAWIAFAAFVVLTVLSPTDVMPESLQEGFFEPYKVKTLPVLLIWILTQIELWRGRRDESGAGRAARLRPSSPTLAGAAAAPFPPVIEDD